MTDLIVFEPLEGWRNDAVIGGALRLVGDAFGTAPAGAVIAGALLLAGEVYGTVGAAPMDPSVPSTIEGSLVLAGDVVGSARDALTVDGALRLVGDVFDGRTGATVDAFVDGALRLAGEVLGPPDLSAYAFLVERPYEMRAYGGLVWESIGDTLGLGAGAAHRHTSVLRAGLALTHRLGHRAEQHIVLADHLDLTTRLAAVFHLLLQDALALGDEHVISYRVVNRLVDRLLLAGDVGSVLEAHHLLADAIAFATSLDPFLHNALLDGLRLEAGMRERLQAAERLIDALVFDDGLEATATVTVLLRDGIRFVDDATTVAEMREVLRDALGFVVRVSIDDKRHVAWVMNTETKALTRYTNYPFNSFMRVGGKVYGVTDGSLRRLGGDTDDGEPIRATIRRGLSDLGERVFKRTPSFILGYSSSGDMRIKAVIVGEDGQREAHVYRLTPQPSANPRNARAKLGRGLRSVYWDFVLENVDGADFTADVFELESMLLARRLRGDAAGRP